MPPSLVNRPVRGLPLLTRWLSRSGRLFLEDQVTRLVEAPHGLFTRRAVLALRSRVNTDPAAGHRLWTLFMLQAWLDTSGIRTT